MESKKINQLATELAPDLSDLTIIGDPTTGISKKITLSQMASLFTGTVEEYANFAAFPLVGVADTIYIALDTNILYRWNTGTSAYVELSPNIVSSLVFNDANGFDGTINLVGSVATLTITTALTTGSVGFIGASGALLQDNANFFYDDTNNRLGLGTNAPTTALDVFGSGIIGRINGTSTNNAYLGFASAGTNKWSVGNVQSDHRFRIFSEANSAELISVLQTGEFGIGIANPTTKFHIDGAASALIANLDANVSVAKSISFRSDNSNRINLEVSGTESGSNAGANFFLRTYTDAGALLATPITITRSTGVVSIPSLALADLTGTLPVANGGTGITTLTAGRIPFGNGTSAFGSSASLFWDNTNSRLGLGTNSPSAKLDVRSTTFTPTSSNAAILVEETGANFMGQEFYINNAGTFLSSRPSGGIGTCNTAALRIAGGGIINGNFTGGGTTNFMPTTVTASVLSIGDQDGFIFYSTNGLTAGTVMNMANFERMRITASGNVGIGSSTPARKFVVQNTSSDPFISIIGAYPNQGGILFGDSTFSDSSCAIRLDRTNNALWFSTDGASNERMRITSTGVIQIPYGQIKFPATQNASSDANTLDDYEEGTWTPTVVTNNGTATGYSSLAGTYTKIGNRVFISGSVRPTGGTLALFIQIGGLPFTAVTAEPRAGNISGCNASNFIQNELGIGAVESTTIPFVMTTAITSGNLFNFGGNYKV